MLTEHGPDPDQHLAELELIYRSAPVGLALIDTDLRFVRVNDMLAALNGLSPAEHIGRRVAAVLPALAPAVEPLLRGVIETGQPVRDLEIRAPAPERPHEVRDWLVNYFRLDDASGEPLGVNVVVQEITAQKNAERELQLARDELEERVAERTADLVATNRALLQQIDERLRAEESLRRSEARYRHLVENVSEAIYAVDAAGTITYVSPRIAQVTGGHTVDEVVGRSFLDFIYPDDLPRVADTFQRNVGGETGPSEYRVLGKDGAVYWIRSHSQPIVEGGRIVGLQGLLTDVTERRRRETLARRRRDELAHVQRLTTAGQMTAEIAHQINQPLAAIANFAGGLAARLRDERPESVAMRDVAMRIGDEARRAGDVVRTLRAFLRKGESVKRRCDLNVLVGRVYGLLEDDFRRAAVESRLRLARRLPALHADEVLIEQVLLNLLRNALEALLAKPARRELEIETAARPEGVEFRLRDTGVGLPRGQEAQIFETFFTTKPDGLGLGLSVSRTIVEANGGRLWAERDPDGGTRMSFNLPAAPPTPFGEAPIKSP